MIDATIVTAPTVHLRKDEKEAVDHGETPSHWSQKQAAHKDTDAHWTAKRGQRASSRHCAPEAVRTLEFCHFTNEFIRSALINR